MSAKKAAQAYLRHDCDFAVFVAALPEVRWGEDYRTEVCDYVRENVLHTWTLSLAAQSASATEEQVIAAILYELQIGSTCVCRGISANMFHCDTLL